MQELLMGLEDPQNYQEDFQACIDGGDIYGGGCLFPGL